ncbi:MAG: hypothetical protein QG648_162 [Patescibacteria group bacterium]|nr:hypothetical protein [Patescibacteria group bacterium]
MVFLPLKEVLPDWEKKRKLKSFSQLKKVQTRNRTKKFNDRPPPLKQSPDH